MLSEVVIKAEPRAGSSKGSVQKLRKSGTVPAVVYGKSGVFPIQVGVKSLPKGHTRTQLVHLEVEGAKKTVLMREVQVDPLTDLPIHIDFQEVAASDVVKTKVPLEFVGLTREQEKEGSFKILLRSLEVKGQVSALPATLKVEVGGLKVDESAHISNVTVPDGVVVRAARNLALASLVKL
jgi:large subunit ribosomal protein L25